MVNSEFSRARAMALGFGLGSLLFALGTVGVWLSLSVVAVSVIFAIGALLFTAAAFVQWRSAVAREPEPAAGFWQRIQQNWHNPDWASAIIQLLGTLYFNVMTVRALVLAIGLTTLSDRGVWHPDYVGSLLFLIASVVAWHPRARLRRGQLLHGRERWVNAANVLGSVFFGLSAWGAKPLIDGSIQSVAASNWGTFLGAIGFLTAALLSWPGRAPERATVPS
ncbi:MAG: hypothetical protein ACOYD0_08385 [Candidatus Nanopelagicales bacterium]